MKINIDYLARVEGEASIKYEIENKKLKSLILNIWEPPRFFEGLIVGRKYDEVPDIVSRICGICPVSHMITSIIAIEKAIDFKPSYNIKNMREIMTLSQIAASHVAHLFVLAMPDYYGLEMFYGLKKEMEIFLRLKECLNNITKIIGGRALHPVSLVVGGFTNSLSKKNIDMMVNSLELIKNDAKETVMIVAELNLPDFETNIEYVSLINDSGYSINEGAIKTNSGLVLDIDNYNEYFIEEQVPYSNAKKTILKSKHPIMVGALARNNIKFDKLHNEAKKLAKSINYNPKKQNPFFNIIAQAIEIVHCIYRCKELLESLSSEEVYIPFNIKEGRGVSITEAPRGLLYHEYELDRKGIIKNANIITPTSYNYLSLKENLKNIIEYNIDKTEKEINLLCEMLVRAYDPCFSCSVH